MARVKPRFLLPGVYDYQVDRFVEEYFTSEDLDGFLNFKVHPLMIYRYTLFFGLIPSLGFIAIAYFTGTTWMYWLALILPIILIWTIFYQRNWRLQVNDDCLKTTSGVFGRNFNLLHLYKVQSVEFSQSWFQRIKE